MNNCPFCGSPIEISWSYCRNCNKPLITDVNNIFNNRIRPILDGTSIYTDEYGEQEENFDVNIINDETIEYELSQLENQLTDSERMGNNMGNLLLEKASLFYRKRDVSNALKNLELALENFEEAEDSMNLIIVHNEIGLMHEETGFFDQAIYHFDRALSFIEEVGDIIKEIHVLNNLGNVYRLINDLENANIFYQKALTLADDDESLELEAIKTASNLVEILLSLKDYDRVKKILKRNLDFFIQTDDIYGVIQTRTKYGKMFYYLGEEYYDQSFSCLTSVLELVEGIKNNISIFIRKKLEWECYLYLGYLHSLWDNLEAEDFLLKSLEAVRTFEIKENIKEGIVLEAIAKFYSLKGEDKKAINYYGYSQDIYHKFGDSAKEAEMKYQVAQIFQEYIQNDQKAIQYYEEALEIFENLNKSKIVADIHSKLGDIYISKNSDFALSNFEIAKKLYAELEDEKNKARIDGKINLLKDTENHNATL